jgi:hypothetical protein
VDQQNLVQHPYHPPISVNSLPIVVDASSHPLDPRWWLVTSGSRPGTGPVDHVAQGNTRVKITRSDACEAPATSAFGSAPFPAVSPPATGGYESASLSISVGG